VTEPAKASVPPAAVAPPLRRYDRSIVDGPLLPAVWKIAWPTMLQNVIGGAQGMIDHALVGNLVGFRGNAAVGVSWQIFIAIIVFVSSVFTGMSVLIARFAGAGEPEKVDRVVYQAFLTGIGLCVLVLAPVGYFAAPYLLDVVNAAPEVKQEALPFLRIMFVFGSGMMVFFMLGGALRSAGDARTPMYLGIALTVLNLLLNIVFIAGLGPIPAYGTKGAAIGTVIAGGLVAVYSIWRLWSGKWVVAFPRERRELIPDWPIIRALFRFGLPAGFQGIAMNIGGVLMLAFIGGLAQSAAAQAAYAVIYTQLFSLISWTAYGLMGASAAVAGQSLGAKKPERAEAAVHLSAKIGVVSAAVVGAVFLFFPRQLLALFGMHEPVVIEIGSQLMRVLSLSGLFLVAALTYTGGLQGTGDTKSPMYISIVSQIFVPLGICFVIQQTSHLDAIDIWVAILIGHFVRCVLSVWRFNQGKWRTIAVDIGSGSAR
jgi:putative MATE family efflux protein